MIMLRRTHKGGGFDVPVSQTYKIVNLRPAEPMSSSTVIALIFE